MIDELEQVFKNECRLVGEQLFIIDESFVYEGSSVLVIY